MPKINLRKGTVRVRREDLVNLVAAPVLAQVNQNAAQMLAKIEELREAVETIARQIARWIPKED